MAKNREPVKPVEPEIKSSDEEDVESESESESDSNLTSVAVPITPSKRLAEEIETASKRLRFHNIRIEEKIMLMGDKLYEEGKLGEEWEKLKMEQCEINWSIMDVRNRLVKLVMDNLK